MTLINDSNTCSYIVRQAYGSRSWAKRRRCLINLPPYTRCDCESLDISSFNPALKSRGGSVGSRSHLPKSDTFQFSNHSHTWIYQTHCIFLYGNISVRETSERAKKLTIIYVCTWCARRIPFTYKFSGSTNYNFAMRLGTLTFSQNIWNYSWLAHTHLSLYF